MSHSQPIPRIIIGSVLLLAITPAASIAQSPGGQKEQVSPIVRQMPKVSVTAFPSPVESLEITPMGEGKAKIVLQLQTGAKLPAEAGRRLEQLKARSIGEGRFQAETSFDFEAFAQEQQRRKDLARRGAMIPVFTGRAMVGLQQVQFIEPAAIKEAVRLKRPFRIPIGVLGGVPITVDPSRELMITDLSVVEDPTRTFDPCTGAGSPMGAWTFGKLMTDMANGTVDPAKMVEDWLKLWTADQTVNSFVVPNRSTGINNLLLSTWKRTGSGELDLSQAPMRLLAIVNRIDLRQNVFYGGGSAGEGRFVFGVLDPNTCSSLPQFTVILEYGVPKSGCAAIHAWAQQWHALGSIVLGTPAFNTALQNITDVFAGPNANPAKPNGSALDQLRTDEVALAFPWELREFHLDASTHEFDEATVKQTPAPSFNGGSTLTNYINANQSAILAGTFVVPDDFPGTSPFLGANAPNGPPTVFWNGTPAAASNDARQQFSVNTCNGCHGGETQTPFLQIHPRAAGTVAQLSLFLLGNGTLTSPNTITVPDPVVTSTIRSFGDLLRRQQDLDSLLGTTCKTIGPLQEAIFKPLDMTD
ncbi:MAG TPA: hypothetical protein VMH00_00775 [Candidatus Limnocylindrales bacterium]|nr:hypothetical protein [Candidatus Limnocylindrales bacterium]